MNGALLRYLTIAAVASACTVGVTGNIDPGSTPTGLTCVAGQVVTRGASGWQCIDASAIGAKGATGATGATGSSDSTNTDARTLGGHDAGYFLAATATAADSAKLGGTESSGYALKSDLTWGNLSGSVSSATPWPGTVPLANVTGGAPAVTPYVARYGAAQGGNFPSGVYSVIHFDTKEYDSASSYDPATGNFTVRAPGTYLFTACAYPQVLGGSGPAPYEELDMNVPGRNVGIGLISIPSATQTSQVCGSALFSLKTGDVVQFTLKHNLGTTAGLIGGAAYNWFSSALVAPAAP